MVEGVVIKLYVPCAAKKAKRASKATWIRDVIELTSSGVPLTALKDTAPKIAKTASKNLFPAVEENPVSHFAPSVAALSTNGASPKMIDVNMMMLVMGTF